MRQSPIIMITAGEGPAAAAAATGHMPAAGDEELKDGDELGLDDEGLRDIPISPTAAGSLDGSGSTVTTAAAAAASKAPLQFRGVTMAAAAARGDLAHVVLLWGMATAEGVNVMLPDEDVRASSIDCMWKDRLSLFVETLHEL